MVWRHVCLTVVLLATTPACSKVLGIGDFSVIPDGPPDTPGPDAQRCYGAGLAPVCLTNPPSGARTLDVALSTDTLTNCTEVIAQPAGPELCVIAATSITVSASVTVTGSRPLMLLASDTISIGGVLDVSSRRSPARTGAGANFTACGAGTLPLANANGAGGGAGGTFGTQGASGGDGNGVNNNGASPAVLALTFVRGGCRGQDGGDVSATVQGGTGGSSGGAVYLFAGTSIDVAGNIFASGAGAGQGGLRAGGGGGGAGGLIGLEAPTINVTGIVAANGAGGSGGSGTGSGGVGLDGATTTYMTQPGGAAGGAPGGGVGGRGGTAAIASTVGGGGVAATSGGGGGGGVGIVWVKGTLTGTMIAPAPTLH